MTERVLVGYDECRCILTQYCDGDCRPVFADRALRNAARATPVDQEMRMETPIENMARDMREGRFPERSEPQMIATPQAPKSEAQSVRDAVIEECARIWDKGDGKPLSIAALSITQSIRALKDKK